MTSQLRKQTVLRSCRIADQHFRDFEVHANVIESEISRSSFVRIKADNHLFGRMVLWTSCNFAECLFMGMISPLNRFVNCTFSDCRILGYSPCETSLIDCQISGCHFECVRAQPNFRNSTLREEFSHLWPYPELAELDTLGTSVLVSGGSIRRCRFIKSSFAGFVLRTTQCSENEFAGCDASDLVADATVRVSIGSEDPLRYFLGEIKTQFYRQSPASSVTLTALQELIGGAATTQDWYGYLMEKKCPQADLDVIDELTERILHP